VNDRIEGSDRGNYQHFPAVEFEHFYGVTPRRYREMFERSRRKGDSGEFLPYLDSPPRPNIDIKTPFYAELEAHLTNDLLEELAAAVEAGRPANKEAVGKRVKRAKSRSSPKRGS
jgi:hypothetical protein